MTAGCDEAGRGCLAGPVFAGAVILPENYYNPKLNDSKKLNEKQRQELREEIEKDALSWSVAKIDPEEIDQINILNASILAMQNAVLSLHIKPAFLLIDGNRFKPMFGIDHECIIKGDGKYLCIAAASILAKTYRDDFMTNLSIKHPGYQWSQNKGYPTIAHRKAIIEHGVSEHHRKSFKLSPTSKQMSLFG